MKEPDALRKPVRDFSDQELTSFRTGRSAARTGERERFNGFAGDVFFERGFNQERLLVRSERGEVILVAGIAVVCQRCHALRLYDAPGCPCWDTAEVVELAHWMKSPQPITPRIAELLNQYRLEYGVLLHRPALANFGFLKMQEYWQSQAGTQLQVLQYPTGEPFILAP